MAASMLLAHSRVAATFSGDVPLPAATLMARLSAVQPCVVWWRSLTIQVDIATVFNTSSAGIPSVTIFFN